MVCAYVYVCMFIYLCVLICVCRYIGARGGQRLTSCSPLSLHLVVMRQDFSLNPELNNSTRQTSQQTTGILPSTGMTSILGNRPSLPPLTFYVGTRDPTLSPCLHGKHFYLWSHLPAFHVVLKFICSLSFPPRDIYHTSET